MKNTSLAIINQLNGQLPIFESVEVKMQDGHLCEIFQCEYIDVIPSIRVLIRRSSRIKRSL